jgi:hypothetical protein
MGPVPPVVSMSITYGLPAKANDPKKNVQRINRDKGNNSEVSASNRTRTGSLLTDHFRCPEEFVDLAVTQNQSPEVGYFRFGSDTICYGRCSSGPTAPQVSDLLYDALDAVATEASAVQLPFDPVQVITNLRHEHYHRGQASGKSTSTSKHLARKLYYIFRPLLSVPLRKHLQRIYLGGWEKIPFPHWPVDTTVENIQERLLALSMQSRNLTRIPFIWFWPNGAPTCTSVTHDVETTLGWNFCSELMDLDDSFGIKAAFQVVPEQRYTVHQAGLDQMKNRGFELNVHDLNHDGNLLTDHEEFLRRAVAINRYGKQFGAKGFRAAVLYRNIDWYGALDFSYDMSIPNVAHLDPQRGGCCTVFPFFNGNMIELPVTMSQDYTILNILKDYSIELWKKQIALIRKKHGLMQMIVHPDYILEAPARRVFSDLLGYLSDLRAQGETWIALPGEVAAWWRLRSQMQIVPDGASWKIVGEGCDSASIAYATLKDGQLQYEFESTRK